MGQQLIKAEDIAMIIDSIIYGDNEEFEDILEWGFDGLEAFSDRLRDSDGTFVVTTVDLGGMNK
ncbi:hypothetical protein [Vagococcus fluvialis]|uniref:hypothetical protein n=1 Tax=Vagococcus fluvialis TaxID=2738 RepID=UPI001D0BB9AF|nr:hypothetical protein [Vagococcus fluvialis]UDM79575.1 hypothetical protein K5K97_12910 [Vagococcus fluvialis]